MEVGGELLLLEEPREGLLHQLFALPDVLEDFPARDEEALVDPDAPLVERAHCHHHPVFRRANGMDGLRAVHRCEGRDDLLAPEVVDQAVERQVRHAVAE